MSSTRRTAVVAGVLFLVTEVAAIGGLALYRPVLEGADYVAGAGADTQVLLGALFEIVLATAVIGTGVTLFPVIRRQSEGAALGHVCGRLLEAAVIVVGIVSVLSVVTLRRDFTGGVEGAGGAPDPDASSFVAAGRALVAIHDWTFLLGPNVALGANTLLLAWLMYRSRLVPRFIAVLGLVGGPLICLSATAVMFGLYEQVSVPGSIAAVPVFAWEATLAIRLIAKGFDPSPTASETGPHASSARRDPRVAV
ncbi:DUF4386 domain-containing protein [Streptomyces sp. NPDC051907]|uniref:DUF4386 domain-containing protein n=1 Tax=Streptomyces sp. NPDC051907 TaxID=3155284 RepID=UPI00341A9BF2